jgi:riboflavin synthase
MFTGIVEKTGVVEQIASASSGIRLTVRAPLSPQGSKIGDSLAVNGCCLTITRLVRHRQNRLLQFDLLEETWRKTNLQFARVGSLVNLERSLPANGRLGGHFVTGHIDGMGRIIRWEREGADHVLDIEAPPAIMRYVVTKGSIAVDGTSLTVAKVAKKRFRIWIIPHTYEVTALRQRTLGDWVNLETDLLGKYVEKFLTSSQAA